MIRVYFPGDTWVDLPEETPADPYGPPVEDEKPPTLEWTRDHGFGVALVFLRGTWLAGRVESCPEEARRLRAERDAAEKRIADLRAWAEKEAKDWAAIFENMRGGTGEAGGTAWDEVVRWIDGKAG